MKISLPILVACMLVAVSSLDAANPLFVPLKIDGPIHNPDQHTYWYGPFSECASVLDIDNDGDLDIAAGRNWYEAPDWKKHAGFRDGAEVNGPETDNNSEFALDVNRDGWTDIVSSGWMKVKGACWYQNPGKSGLAAGAKWQTHRFHSARSMEGVIHGDIDGDGDDDILCNHWSLEPDQQMTWYEAVEHPPWLVEHAVGTEGETHGNGLGDINGDGRCDIVTPVGWYEQPDEDNSGAWPFHADYRFEVSFGSSAASHPMLVHDVNDDGQNDIIVGAAHTYGLAWLEQTIDDQGERSFVQHWVEQDLGQFHTMAIGDLDGDGQGDLVTGKRLFAHHGRDVSCYEPLFIFWYEMNGRDWQRHPMAFNFLTRMTDDETRQNPVPQFVPAAGMKLNIADMDGDGDQDVVVAGKGGLYLFRNHGVPVRQRPKLRLPAEETYPSWTPWYGQ